MKKIAVLFVYFLLAFNTYAQEINARVQVLAPNVTNLNRRNLDVMQNNIRDFINNNKWTAESYLPQERIECNLVITITSWDGNSTYNAEAQVQSNRPVYGTSYNTTLLNFSDKDFAFNYTEGQSLDFSEQNYIGSLNSLIGFYAFTIIGLDKDSFSKTGGSLYYQKAQNLLNLAQSQGGKGWRAADGLRNRYWLNENLLSNQLKPLRIFIYNYHLNGLDKLQNNLGSGLKGIMSALSDLQQFDKQKLGSIFPNVFFAGKADEMVNVLSNLNAQDRNKAFNLLTGIDPANNNKYQGLKKL
ncbi:type IX secretion system protein PorD [Pedobacter montanisoli]|uniref:DUF4835 family protein n=1 Tax=Pedobacter montanisoli TaxID=2923277 RepID=A0ABS9ZW45_9SPHI|nr:DUF4835 family protein [Pedobacter montanisoli]MCJ0742523.1 DUF4835 family protein [Pedobacter montanisoli]